MFLGGNNMLFIYSTVPYKVNQSLSPFFTEPHSLSNACVQILRTHLPVEVRHESWSALTGCGAGQIDGDWLPGARSCTSGLKLTIKGVASVSEYERRTGSLHASNCQSAAEGIQVLDWRDLPFKQGFDWELSRKQVYISHIFKKALAENVTFESSERNSWAGIRLTKTKYQDSELNTLLTRMICVHWADRSLSKQNQKSNLNITRTKESLMALVWWHLGMGVDIPPWAEEGNSDTKTFK